MFTIRIRRGTLAATAAAVALVNATAPDAAAQLAANGRIAYVACEPGSIPFFPDQCDVWTMNADGTDRTNLTRTPDRNEVGPAWSPDGARIAFVEGWSTFTLMTMGADGTDPTPHPTVLSSPGGAAPTWAPDGGQLAFVGVVPEPPLGSRTDVIALDLRTGVETPVTQPVDFGGVLVDAEELEPAWSPDGGRVAFASVRPEQFPDPETGEPSEGAQYEIVLVNADGTGDTVVSAGAPGSDRARFLEEDRAPAWSPDGRMLVFMSQAQVPSCCGPWQIWAVNRDGTGATNLTDDASVSDTFPSWSPDGTQIVFSRSDGSGTTDLWAMPAPATLPPPGPLAARRLARAAAATRLTSVGNAREPDWGRDGGTAVRHTLTVAVEKIGRRSGGHVLSAPKGIRCGRRCTAAWDAGTRVTLTAHRLHGSVFAGWAGACTGTAPTCDVTMDAARSVTATFRRR